MFIKNKVVAGVLFALSLQSSFSVNAFEEDDETIKEQTDRLANGLNTYIRSVQEELLNSGKKLIEEHEDDTKTFIDDYNDYTDNIVEKTSKPISLSGDSDCLANLRLIDIDIIPVDPMDLLKPLKLKIKDLITKSPCEMITDTINDELDRIDFAADSPFGSIGIKPNLEDQQADAEKKRLEKLQRKARVKTMIFDMGSDFKLKVEERREVVFDEDGSVVTPSDDYEVKTVVSPLKTENLLNTEGLLNMQEVFGAFFPAGDQPEPLPSGANNINSGSNQSSLESERQLADDAARAASRIEGDN